MIEHEGRSCVLDTRSRNFVLKPTSGPLHELQKKGALAGESVELLR